MPTTATPHRADVAPTDVARWCDALERDGYVRIPGAVPPELLERLDVAVDAVRVGERAAGRLRHGEPLHLLGFAARDPVFAELVDLSPTFDVVCRMLGWNIHVYHSHLDVHPPAPHEPDPAWGWHQDGGRLNVDLETEPRPRVSLKAVYWLSDVSRPGHGNTRIIPGSHRRNTLTRPWEGGPSDPHGAVELLAGRGDAVVFDRRLWHSRSVNRSATVRRALFLAYAPRWLRARDDHRAWRLGDHYVLTPVRRQLLGMAGSPMDDWGLGEDPVALRDRQAGR
jgi:hypothetical protein